MSFLDIRTVSACKIEYARHFIVIPYWDITSQALLWQQFNHFCFETLFNSISRDTFNYYTNIVHMYLRYIISFFFLNSLIWWCILPVFKYHKLSKQACNQFSSQVSLTFWWKEWWAYDCSVLGDVTGGCSTAGLGLVLSKDSLLTGGITIPRRAFAELWTFLTSPAPLLLCAWLEEDGWLSSDWFCGYMKIHLVD